MLSNNGNDPPDLIQQLSQVYPHIITYEFDGEVVAQIVDGETILNRIIPSDFSPRLLEIFFNDNLVYAMSLPDGTVLFNQLAQLLSQVNSPAA